MSYILEKAKLDERYFHRADDHAFFNELDDLLAGPLKLVKPRKRDPEIGIMIETDGPLRKMRDFALLFSFVIGKAHKEMAGKYPKGELDHNFRFYKDHWLVGSLFPIYPGAVVEHSPYKPDENVLVAAMFCSHDGVCDEPAMATVFLEGGLRGDIDNLAVIMIYETSQPDVVDKLDEMGVLIMYSDDKLKDTDIETYFPVGCLRTYHDDEAGHELRVKAEIPIPLLSESDNLDVTTAYALSVISSMVYGITDDEMPVRGVSAWRCVEEALGFIEVPKPEFETLHDQLAFENEKNPERRRTWKKPDRQSQPLPQELIRVMNEVDPRCNYEDFLLESQMIRKRLTEICKPWQETMNRYRISFSDWLPLACRISEAERSYIVHNIQELGRKLEVDVVPVGDSVSMAQAAYEIWCEQNPEEAEDTEA